MAEQMLTDYQDQYREVWLEAYSSAASLFSQTRPRPSAEVMTVVSALEKLKKVGINLKASVIDD